MLKGVFGPFKGSVAHDRAARTAEVTFADARSLQQARDRVGGGERGSFRVMRGAPEGRLGASAAPRDPAPSAAGNCGGQRASGNSVTVSLAGLLRARPASDTGLYNAPGRSGGEPAATGLGDDGAAP